MEDRASGGAQGEGPSTGPFAGDSSAFESIVRRIRPRLLATARRILGHDEDARDATQEALLSAFRAIGSFDGKARLSTWLHRIVVNASLIKLRRRRRRPEQFIEELSPEILQFVDRAVRLWPAHHPGPAAERQELCGLVRRCINRLPESHRLVLLLRDIEELDTEQTAALLGVSVGVVKTRLFRARRALRAELEPYLRDEESRRS